MPGPIATSHATAYNQLAGFAEKITPEELAPEHGVYAITPGGSHILWLLGHIAISADYYIGGKIGLKASIPAEWNGLFGMGSKPVADATKYPPFAELRAGVIDGHKRLAAHVAAMSEESLVAPMPEGFALKAIAPNVDAFLSFGQLHSNYHLGQVTMLLKAQGLKAGVGA